MLPPAALSSACAAAITPLLLMSPPGAWTKTCSLPVVSRSSTWVPAARPAVPIGALIEPSLLTLRAISTTSPDVEVMVREFCTLAVDWPEKDRLPPVTRFKVAPDPLLICTLPPAPIEKLCHSMTARWLAWLTVSCPATLLSNGTAPATPALKLPACGRTGGDPAAAMPLKAGSSARARANREAFSRRLRVKDARPPLAAREAQGFMSHHAMKISPKNTLL